MTSTSEHPPDKIDFVWRIGINLHCMRWVLTRETTRLPIDWYDVFVLGLRRGFEEGRRQSRRRIHDTSPDPMATSEMVFE